jgi:ATP-binding cassette subfamily F protein uup
VLVLDEPTNDLDIDTLDLLEELLQGYAGTVFWSATTGAFSTTWSPAPSPGRATRPSAGAPACGANTKAATRTGSCSASAPACWPRPPRPAPAAAPKAAEPPRPAATRTKLSYKEQRELDALPARIEALEAEQATLNQRLADSALYAREPERAAELHARHAAIDEELMAALERWEALASR